MLANKLLKPPQTTPTYIEDVFSTYLYTGTSASGNAIVNGLDLATKGGLVWTKNRGLGTTTGQNALVCNDVGLGSFVSSNSTAVAGSLTATGFNTNGYTLNTGNDRWNGSAYNYVSWTFRKQPKFFDVVTYTGTGVARTIAHNLGSAPGCIIVKSVSAIDDWAVYHRSADATNPQNYTYYLNQTVGRQADSSWNGTQPTSTVFSVSGSGYKTNENGVTYVAYLFAHDAGGFGLTGTDNVISCGSFTTDGSANATVTLGYEPQFVMIKGSSTASNWNTFDVMRGMAVGGSGSNNDQILYPNLSSAETASYGCDPTATGFVANGWATSSTYIYIAIRRGPMKVPTDATKVFSPIASSASTGTVLTTGFPVDLQIDRAYSLSSNTEVVDRLRGVSTNSTGSGETLYTNLTDGQASNAGSSLAWDNTGFQMNSNLGALNSIYWNFRRAPGFFDEVCYTGTGVARTVTHNLGVAPELMIVRIAQSGQAGTWMVYDATDGNTKYTVLNSTAAATTGSTVWNNTPPTSSVFTVGTSANTNASGINLVAYLFATCAGVSKVGSYTGAGLGTSQQINCGFTAGARLVIIKRTDTTGSWYIWDTARGIVAANDPYLLLNTTSAQISTDYLDTYSAGFEITVDAPGGMNASGGTFIYLAIA